MLRSVLIGFVALGIGCASVPGVEEVKNGHYATLPTAHEAMAISAIKQRLFDAESARFGKVATHQVFEKRHALRGGGVAGHYWVVTTTVNAKNRFGGYTGFHRVYTLFDRGHIARVRFENDSERGTDWKVYFSDNREEIWRHWRD